MVTIILPTYNERENVRILVNEILKVFPEDCEIIVVDDNSPDGTWEVVEKISQRYPQVKIIRRINERGLTSAFKRGISESGGEIVCWMDCDLSMPPSVLKEMVNKINSADIAVGSRFIPGGKDERAPSYPYLFSRIINLLCQILLYHDFRDYTSGFIALKRKVLEDLVIEGDYGEYFIYLIAQAKKRGYRIVEVPYTCASRRYGTTKTSPNLLSYARKGVKYILTVIKGVKLKWQREK